MSVYPCSRHGQRAPGKLASVYWAWFDADGVRHAYKERLCIPCFVENVVAWNVEAEANPNSCPVCHTVAQGDADPVFSTVYVPGRGPEETVWQTCGVCAVRVRGPIVASGDPLGDRELGASVEGPRPLTQASPTAAWDAIGLRGPDTHDG